MRLKQRQSNSHFLTSLKINFFLALIFLNTVGVACSKSSLDPMPEPEQQLEEQIPNNNQGEEPTEFDTSMFYVPNEFKSMDFTNTSSRWCYQRSKQSEHFIVFWEAGFGADPNAASVSENMRVDVDDLLAKAESFFTMNVNTLGFADVGHGKSNLDIYKMEIYLLYQEEWLATGSGYDDVIGALWVNPSTCKPVGSTIAHEIGHSFQYQTYCDLLAFGGISNDFSRGFRYGFGGNGGNGFWEQCAQWQSFQSYPEQIFSSYHYPVYMENYHRSIFHEDQRYASYFIQYYWTAKHGIDFIGKLWREAQRPEDPLEAYMRMNSLSVADMNAELYDAVSKLVTWDLDAIRSYGADYIGGFTYKFYQLEDGSYQVAYEKCPGTTGYNVIPLNVPAAGTVVTTAFTGLTPGTALAGSDPGRYKDGENTKTKTTYNPSEASRAGWRYGYVALLDNGERVYGDMNSALSANVEFTVPEGCERLWFVVLGAPSSYKAHAWDENESNDDQWPYTVKFSNTDLLGNITIDENATPKDLTLTYNLSFPATSAGDYTGKRVNLNSNGDITKVAQALAMQPATISSNLLASNEAAKEGKIAVAAVQKQGAVIYQTTANGYGFWFDSQGNVTTWGSDNDSKLFVEFTANNFEFNIGQFPGKCQPGDTYSVKDAFVYTKDGTLYKVTFVFNVTIQ